MPDDAASRGPSFHQPCLGADEVASMCSAHAEEVSSHAVKLAAAVSMGKYLAHTQGLELLKLAAGVPVEAGTAVANLLKKPIGGALRSGSSSVGRVGVKNLPEELLALSPEARRAELYRRMGAGGETFGGRAVQKGQQLQSELGVQAGGIADVRRHVSSEVARLSNAAPSAFEEAGTRLAAIPQTHVGPAIPQTFVQPRTPPPTAAAGKAPPPRGGGAVPWAVGMGAGGLTIGTGGVAYGATRPRQRQQPSMGYPTPMMVTASEIGYIDKEALAIPAGLAKGIKNFWGTGIGQLKGTAGLGTFPGQVIAKSAPAAATVAKTAPKGMSFGTKALLGTGAVVGTAGLGGAGYLGYRHASNRMNQFQHTAYQHGGAGPRNFMVSSQM